MGLSIDTFVAKWSASGAAERANKDAFLLELADVLDVPRPNPTTGDSEKDSYVFEKDALTPHEGGQITVGKIDLFKAGCFILEAKQGSDATAKKVGTARRGTPAWNISMRDAYGQALGYAQRFDKPVPFLIACDLGYCFDLYAAFDGSWNYRPFPNAQASRIFFADLPKHADTLRAVFLDPLKLDPSKHAAKVTREVASHLAELAKTLEKAGHPSDAIATFLMRCLFTMFAEDVGLLPEGIFTKAIEEMWLPSPPSFTGGVESMWRTMNEGGTLFMVGKLLRFNGGLFANPIALPLDREGLKFLLEAAKCNWSDVEPAIFGTLLERALDPKERHALGAHYTPRAYVERLVRPTIEEPLRADWQVVQAEVRQLVAANKIEPAKKAVLDFQKRLCSIRVLDPACGSGNFLYVTLDLFKRLEGEVLALLNDLGDTQSLLHMETVRVTPAQFLGIEIKRWAKEIAELVLWIGYLQWHFRTYGRNLPVPEPVLRDYKNIEWRDAVLAYETKELVVDDKGKPVTAWDGETYKVSPVTGERVPDESAQAPVYRYVKPTRAVWPKADFIVGNPPFIGNKRMRQALGDGYVESLRAVYDTVPEVADYVMYWWETAAAALRGGQVRRFGLITTNSITQSFNRKVLATHIDAPEGLSLVFAIPDHPWVDSADGAAVRIAMTVAAPGRQPGIVHRIVSEDSTLIDGAGVTFSTQNGAVHADLRVGANVVAAPPLASNGGLAFQGVIPLGDGFRLTRTELESKGIDPANLPPVVRRFVIGRDIVQRFEERWVIDFFGMSADDASSRYPALFQHLLTRVKPERDQNRRETRKRNWWLFGENAPKLRRAMAGLRRVIGTPDTSKFKPFVFFDADVLPDVQVYTVASDDAFLLGVLSSRPHQAWLQRVAPRMGMGNDLRWKPAIVFAPFPFPACEGELRKHIRELAERLDAHRKRQQAAYPEVTLTSVYNVLEKLRSGDPLSEKEKVVHEQGLVSVLKQLHDEIDRAAFDAYGWPHDLSDEQILERLVALNAERSDEERKGIIRWLRPELQNPKGMRETTQVALGGLEAPDDDVAGGTVAPVKTPWPKKLPEQISAIRDLVLPGGTAWTVTAVAASFKGAKGADVEAVMESLAALGLLVAYDADGKRKWKAARVAA